MAPGGMRAYGEVCGWTLARAHARSGNRIAIAAYIGSSDVLDQAVAEFASAYADQNERDQAEGTGLAVASGGLTRGTPPIQELAGKRVKSAEDPQS